MPRHVFGRADANVLVIQPLGEGGDAALQRRVRAQGNFTEYVPMALLVIGAVEAAGYDYYAAISLVDLGLA